MTEHSNDKHHQAFVTSDRKHILMITNHGIHQWNVLPGLPDTGGQNVFVNQFTEALAKFGYKITIVNRGGYEHPLTKKLHRGLRYKDEHQRIIYIEDSKKEFVRKEDMDAQLPELVQFLQEFLEDEETEVDLILSHYWDAAKLGVLYNRTRPEPVKHVWVPHSLGAVKKRNVKEEEWPKIRIDERIEVERSLIDDLDGIAATSSVIRQSLLDDYWYNGPDLFLPPCVDPDRYHPLHQVTEQNEIWEFLSEHTGLTPEEIRNSKIITEISRTDTTKRKDVLIKAFAQVHQEIPNSLLVVTIDENRTELYQELTGLIRELGLENRVAVLGSVWDILPIIYAVTTVYCTPSVMEGFGMTPQEAGATKVPVVSSHLVPFVVEYLLGPDIKKIPYDGDAHPPLRQGSGAIVVQADDVNGFAHALTMLLTDDLLRQEMGENAYQITIPYFTWGHVVNDFLEKIGVIEQQLQRDTLRELLQAEDLEEVSYTQLVEFFHEETALTKFMPDGICRVDPRTGDRIVYNSARARRPHDNRPPAPETAAEASKKDCVVCQGNTTGVVDVAELSEGFTFINKNLFPVLYPRHQTEGVSYAADSEENLPGPEGMATYGLHLLQWTSSRHDKDWQNMPLEDRVVVMKRLAVLEKKLLTGVTEEMPASQIWQDQDNLHGFVSIIKNHGRLVGGSLVHGHQQIGFSNVMPRRFRDNWRFEQQRNEPFSAYLQRENPPELLLQDYGEAMLVVPYCMRRPFDMMLLLKDTSKRYLHQLDQAELTAVARGWHDAIRVMLWVMPQIGRETAYNIVTHNGPGAGLYFEFLPYTQETGGFEHLGLFICQANPENAAAQIRGFLEQG